ncbi:MAG: putative diacylglycerol kinase [Bacteroidetes bacterium]|nr:putative diacylglycerol kinase [Bacteroidota bacterium]
MEKFSIKKRLKSFTYAWKGIGSFLFKEHNAWIPEAFNTSIERLVNLVSPQENNIAGDVKDIAAGAVLICAIAAAIVGLIIFLPHFIACF